MQQRLAHITGNLLQNDNLSKYWALTKNASTGHNAKETFMTTVTFITTLNNDANKDHDLAC